jgi:hypothetical protein
VANRFTLALLPAWLWAHDPITTKITFSSEIIRIIHSRCAGCHRESGPAPMPLLTYEQTRPWAKAIKEEVLERRMPPWGAVKGFGEFADDPSLTPEEMHMIADWVEGGAPEGDPVLMPLAPRLSNTPPVAPPRGLAVANGFTFPRAIRLGSIRLEGLAERDSAKVIAMLPDRTMQPLLWVHAFDPKAGARTYFYREPLRLPANTLVVIVPPGRAKAILIEAPSRRR